MIGKCFRGFNKNLGRCSFYAKISLPNCKMQFARPILKYRLRIVSFFGKKPLKKLMLSVFPCCFFKKN